jgi:hypothetical protein
MLLVISIANYFRRHSGDNSHVGYILNYDGTSAHNRPFSDLHSCDYHNVGSQPYVSAYCHRLCLAGLLINPGFTGNTMVMVSNEAAGRDDCVTSDGHMFHHIEFGAAPYENMLAQLQLGSIGDHFKIDVFFRYEPFAEANTPRAVNFAPRSHVGFRTHL